MPDWWIVDVECPSCGVQVSVVCRAGVSNLGTVFEKECSEGHVFLVRFTKTGCEVISEEQLS